MEDYIIRATAADGQIRAFFADTKNTVQKAHIIHDTTPVVTAAIGRTLTATAIMGIMLKGEKDIVTVQIKGDGPIGGIVATGDSKANVKGYIYKPYVDIPLKSNGKLDVSGAIGNGTLSVIKDEGLKEAYTGQVPLQSGEIAEDLTYYFAKSEQTPSVVALGVLVDIDMSVKQSGGFILQLMPNATEETISFLENKINSIPAVTQMLESGNRIEDILENILGELGYKILDKIPTQFYCNCSRQRVEKALISVGKNDLKEILETDKKAQLNCHFCNKKYDFSEQDLKTIIKSLN